jgi:ABC-type transport system substrate-binding protein
VKRLILLALAGWLAAGATLAQAPTAAATAPPGGEKVLRYAFPVAETTFDPAQVTDLYSSTVLNTIFEAPYEYAYLAEPTYIRPMTAAAMPEVSADYRTTTIRIKPGIHFADDPAFQGRKRELVAQDYVYAIKRHYDPRWKSGRLYLLENLKLLGLSELRKELIAAKKPFDYDREVEGLRALDRYTLQIRTAEPQPRLLHQLAQSAVVGAVAREVVEHYGDRIGDHPVGTGAFRLAEWKRSSRITLARNTNYRENLYDEKPVVGDETLKAQVRALKGRRLPMVDKVVISIIEEVQPRWLSFLNEEHDLIENVPAEFSGVAFPNNQLAPNLRKRGVQMQRYARADLSMSYFGMENPVVGGYEPHKIALRRAISLAVDLEREIRLVRRGQAIPAQGLIGPRTYGYDAAFKSEMSDHDLARAKALLDLHGYVDRDGDGWRDQPDGKPLELEYATQPEQQSRQLVEQWQRNMDALKIRIRFKVAKWPENLKASRAGRLMMWGVGWNAGEPDGDTFLAIAYGPNKGQSNHSRFDLPEYNRLYEAQRMLPDGPERQALMAQAQKLAVAYMPIKSHVHRVWTDLAYPWVKGYYRNLFVNGFYRYVDVDNAELNKGQQP